VQAVEGGDLTDVLVATAVTASLYGGLLWFALTYGEGQYSQVLVLEGIAASALGWILRIVASPYNSTERASFSGITRLVYGFISGYVISKLDPFINQLLVTANGKPIDHRVAVMALFAFACFLVTVGMTYITRSYWHAKPRPT
jgi:hypothetical protein